MKQCAECNSPVFSKGLCTRHWKIKYGKAIKRTPLKKKVNKSSEQKRKPIAKSSGKQRKRIAEYSKGKREKFFDRWIDGGGFIQCEARLEGCMNNAIDPHHVWSREGEALTDFENIIPLCRSCHNFCKEHPKEAEQLGLIISRIKINASDNA